MCIRDRCAGDFERLLVPNQVHGDCVAIVREGSDDELARVREMCIRDRFEGARRRFTQVGEVRGVTLVDDYGHHCRRP